MSPGLTDEQLTHFNTFGYVVLKKLFTDDELGRIDRLSEIGYFDAPGVVEA